MPKAPHRLRCSMSGPAISCRHEGRPRLRASGPRLARTNSAGRTKNHATGAEGPEANQELFLFQKIGGAWKIARYCFAQPNRREGDRRPHQMVDDVL